MKPTKKSDDDSLLQQAKWINENPALRKSKYYINTGSFRLHNHPSMIASKENKLPTSFPGFKSQEQTMMNIEQSLNNSASVFYLWLLEAFS